VLVERRGAERASSVEGVGLASTTMAARLVAGAGGLGGNAGQARGGNGGRVLPPATEADEGDPGGRHGVRPGLVELLSVAGPGPDAGLPLQRREDAIENREGRVLRDWFEVGPGAGLDVEVGDEVLVALVPPWSTASLVTMTAVSGCSSRANPGS
jgi:hypothetical protein